MASSEKCSSARCRPCAGLKPGWQICLLDVSDEMDAFGKTQLGRKGLPLGGQRTRAADDQPGLGQDPAHGPDKDVESLVVDVAAEREYPGARGQGGIDAFASRVSADEAVQVEAEWHGLQPDLAPLSGQQLR